MEMWRVPLRHVVFAAVLIAAIPVAIFHIDHRLYAQAAIATSATLVGAVLLTNTWLRRPVAAPRIERVDRILTPVRPVTLRVLRSQGGCPLGFQPGNSWSVDGQGQIAPALCQGAIREISPMLQLPPSGDGLEQQVACRCPMRGKELVFGIQPLAPAA